MLSENVHTEYPNLLMDTYLMSVIEPYYSGIQDGVIPDIPRQPLHVVLDNIRSAFNVGAMFRTADACAVHHMHLCGMSAHPPHPKLEKTALGAFAYVPWTYYERTSDCLRTLKEQQIPCIAIEVTENAIPHVAFDWPQPVAVVFGNEVTGVHERNMNKCDAVVKIPMMGIKNSINVATAFGVILYNILDRWKTFEALPAIGVTSETSER